MTIAEQLFTQQNHHYGISSLSDLFLTTTYLNYHKGFWRQKHGCTSVAHCSRPLHGGNGKLFHSYRYVDDTWVKIKTQLSTLPRRYKYKVYQGG